MFFFEVFKFLLLRLLLLADLINLLKSLRQFRVLLLPPFAHFLTLLALGERAGFEQQAAHAIASISLPTLLVRLF